MKATLKLWTGRGIDTDDEPDIVEELEVWDDYFSKREPPSQFNVQEGDEGDESSDKEDLSLSVDFENEISEGDIYTLADNLHHHMKYEIDVDADEPVTLFIHTNDSVHAPNWSRPIEGGLWYGPDIDERPFGCEMWGQVQMWIATRGDDQ